MLQVLPSGFALPPLPYLVGLVAAVGVAGAALRRRRPSVTEAAVAALAPWMAAGGALYALFQAGAVPAPVAPLFGSPAVYATVGAAAGLAWAAVADRPADGWTAGAPAVLAAAGVGLLLVALAGAVGLLAVFGHALDGVSTAVGYDLLGFGEQTPLSRLIIEVGAGLPAPAVLGDAWLFVLVKLLVGAAVVVAFDGYVRETPTEGYPLLGLVAAVGLGPGAHNVVLFAVT